MGRPESHIDPAEGPLQRFAYDLRTLRKSAGSPSYRALASLANYSGTSLSEAARGVSFPSLDVTLAYAQACGGDTEFWSQYWKETEVLLSDTIGRAVDATECRSHQERDRSTRAGTGLTPVRKRTSRPPWGRFAVALPTIAALAGMAGLPGLTRRKHEVVMTVVASSCLASGFLLGRSLNDQ